MQINILNYILIVVYMLTQSLYAMDKITNKTFRFEIESRILKGKSLLNPHRAMTNHLVKHLWVLEHDVKYDDYGNEEYIRDESLGGYLLKPIKKTTESVAKKYFNILTQRHYVSRRVVHYPPKTHEIYFIFTDENHEIISSYLLVDRCARIRNTYKKEDSFYVASHTPCDIQVWGFLVVAMELSDIYEEFKTIIGKDF